MTILIGPCEDTGSPHAPVGAYPHRRSVDHPAVQHSGPGLAKTASEPLYERRIAKRLEALLRMADSQATANWEPRNGARSIGQLPGSLSCVLDRWNSAAVSACFMYLASRAGVELFC